MDKSALRAKFSAEWEKHYKVGALVELGYSRQKCAKCGRHFWSVEERKICSDASCMGYAFIGKRMAKKPLGYVETWKKIEEYFTKNGHASIEPYPTVARWRDDLYFTIASINDFQPYVVSGELEPPANPLVVPQECIRFPDISNVGVTGRHYTTFVMVGQHAFNTEKTGLFYWKDEAITHDINYLRHLGIEERHLVFSEDVWAGGGNFGPCIEYFADGLELGNCVFMQYEELAGGKSRELSTKVIDMGAGLERLAWITHGSAVSYGITFGRASELILRNAGIKADERLFLEYARLSGALDADESAGQFGRKQKEIAQKLGMEVEQMNREFAPLHAAYACADHLKTILFASTDGMLPSNSGGGYNLRMILRRVFGFDGEHAMGIDYAAVLEAHAHHLRDMFPKLKEGVPTAIAVVEEERKKYEAGKEKSKGKVASLLSRGKKIGAEELRRLYESDGIPPELVAEIAKERGMSIEVPENFYSSIRKQDETGKPPEPPLDVEGQEKTKPLFYEGLEEFEARVLEVKGDFLILDSTAFYPEGGGQVCDIGEIGGKRVKRVIKEKGVILHEVECASSFRRGQTVFGRVDGARRKQIAIHHTAIHLINACARQVLGQHIWQAGSYKDEQKAHIDLTHYRRISWEELEKIERLANEYVLAGLPIRTEVLGRNEAERKYGFRLYQGGAVPGRELRVVSIGDIDHQACGGTHNYNKSTAEFGLVKIVRREGVQDGVERVVIKAGAAAIEYIQQRERLLREAAEALSVPEEQLKNTALRFFNEWKERGKEIEKLQAILSETICEIEVEKAKKEGRKEIELLGKPYPQKLCEEIAGRLSKAGYAAVILTDEGFVVAAAPAGSRHSALELLKRHGAKGGGTAEFARGKVQKNPQ
ncbi:MAG: alanine--tRNA ligase [Candidatus Micrarchaeota archaeon]|nr:alanine--tRNA ligase [Candidatus Micrarchaeota archaeon]